MHGLVPCTKELSLTIAFQEIVAPVPLTSRHTPFETFLGIIRKRVIDCFVETEQRLHPPKRIEKVGTTAAWRGMNEDRYLIQVVRHFLPVIAPPPVRSASMRVKAPEKVPAGDMCRNRCRRLGTRGAPALVRR